MRFSNLFTTAIAASVPAMAVANQMGYAELMGRSEEIVSLMTRQTELMERQTGLDSLVSLLDSLKTLLSTTFIDDVEIVVTHLAALLNDPFPNQTRGLVTTASDLLTTLSPVLSAVEKLDLTGLTTAVTSLLTTDNVNAIGSLLGTLNSINITGLVDSASGLLTPSNINVLSDLLSTVGSIDIKGLLSSIQPLLTTNTINEIGSLLTNANNLLTPTFVNETVALIGDVEPLVASVAQFVTALISALLG